MNAQRNTPTVTIIATIGILVVAAAVAYPAWRNHQAQTHVATALQAADAAKVVVMEAATVGGNLANLKASALAYTPAATTNPYVASVAIADGGLITLTTKGTGATPDPILLLVPSVDSTGNPTAAITWACMLAIGSSSTVPPNCRTQRAAQTPVAPPIGSATAASSAG